MAVLIAVLLPDPSLDVIQRRRIAFERAKQRRSEILAQRARSNDDEHATSNDGAQDMIEEPVIDLM